MKRLLSILLLAIALAGAATVYLNMESRRSHVNAEAVSRCHAELEKMGVAVSLFMLDCGTAPESPRELLTNVSVRIGWLGPYLPTGSSLSDPWGREYAIVSDPGPRGKVSVVSHGRRLSDTNDDLVLCATRE